MFFRAKPSALIHRVDRHDAHNSTKSKLPHGVDHMNATNAPPRNFCVQNLRCSCHGRSRTAINRAVETIPGNSLVAVLSTSARLLPASTADVSAPAPSMPMADNEAGRTINGILSQQSSSDVFVVFEKIKSAVSARSSWMSPAERAAEFGPREDGSQRNPGAGGTRYDHYGHARYPNDAGDDSRGLLITAVLPSDVTSDDVTSDGEDVWSSHRAQGDRVQSPGEEGEAERQDRHKGTEGARQARSEAGPPRGARISDVAPIPLLVFDTETFWALGELDERFAFQGGVAEWISRARLGDVDGGGAVSLDASCRCDASPRRRRRSPGRQRSETGRDFPTGPACSGGTTTAVHHVHAREWGKRFVGTWAADGVRPSTASFSEETGKLDERRPGVGWPASDDGQRGEVGKRVVETSEVAGVDEAGQPRNLGDRTSEGATVDQWTRLPPEKLEALVQADADLFFLPLLLLQNHSGEH